ncbi:hypothetical protein GWI33_000175 [Rhynchophorus ferrugineus]|uniref:Uncharacterized protein n=1 Tax=Rhynchophorus ferrugineus TaxID=354439 RepID=A0A834IVL8_RHYFE|nr:hypothetical protein GWI33_000175 [Rhynchophorus ferrugineus]
MKQYPISDGGGVHFLLILFISTRNNMASTVTAQGRTLEPTTNNIYLVKVTSSWRLMQVYFTRNNMEFTAGAWETTLEPLMGLYFFRSSSNAVSDIWQALKTLEFVVPFIFDKVRRYLHRTRQKPSKQFWCEAE